MGAAASCVERVGKRKPDGPLLKASDAANGPASDPLTAYHATPKAPVPNLTDYEKQKSSTRGRRRPTVSPLVAQAEQLRLKASRDTSEIGSEDGDGWKEDRTAQTLQKERIQKCREAFAIETRYRSGLFDKAVTLDVDKDTCRISQPCRNCTHSTTEEGGTGRGYPSVVHGTHFPLRQRYESKYVHLSRGRTTKIFTGSLRDSPDIVSSHHSNNDMKLKKFLAGGRKVQSSVHA